MSIINIIPKSFVGLIRFLDYSNKDLIEANFVLK